jgi:hypothetical protein
MTPAERIRENRSPNWEKSLNELADRFVFCLENNTPPALADLNNAARELYHMAENRPAKGKVDVGELKATIELLKSLQNELSPQGFATQPIDDEITRLEGIVAGDDTNFDKALAAERAEYEIQFGKFLATENRLAEVELERNSLRDQLAAAQAQSAMMWGVIEKCLDSFGHQHWDETMEHGQGCHLCLKQREARKLAHGLDSPILGQGILDQLAATQKERDSLLNAIFETCGTLPGVSSEELLKVKFEELAEMEAEAFAVGERKGIIRGLMKSATMLRDAAEEKYGNRYSADAIKIEEEASGLEMGRDSKI